MGRTPQYLWQRWGVPFARLQSIDLEFQVRMGRLRVIAAPHRGMEDRKSGKLGDPWV